MVETHLPAACWLMVALIAAFTVWMSLSVLAATMHYEKNRQKLARNVRKLQRRYSMSFPDVIMGHDVIRDIGPSGRKAA